MELFRLLGVVAVDNAQAINAIDETVQHAKKSDSMLSSLGKGMMNVGSGFTKYITKPALVAGAALAGVTLKKGWDRMVEIDNAKVKLEAIGNSAEDVTKIMENANAAVKGTSYGLNEAATTAASAVAAGIAPGKELERYLTNVSDAAAVAGVDMAEMGSVMNKVATQGKANNEVLLQMADSGIPIYQYLADELGVTADAVFDMASRGEIDLETFQRAVENNIGGAAKTIGSKTISGAISNIWASIGRIGANFLGAGDDANTFAGKLLPVLNDVKDWLGGVEEKAKVWGQVFGRVFEKIVDGFQKIPNSMKVAFGVGLVAIGPLLQVTGFLITQAGKIQNNIRKIQQLYQIMTMKQVGADNRSIASQVRLIGARISSAASTAASTVATTANTIATKINSSAMGRGAGRILAFAAAHKVAMLASLGVIGALVGLGIYMSKTGQSADEVAQRITDFSNRLAAGITAMADKIPGMIESFTAAFVSIINAVVAVLPKMIPVLVQAAISLFMALITALNQIIPALVQTIPQVVMAVVNALPILIPALINGGITLFMALVDAIPKIIPPLIEAIPQIITAIVGVLPVLIPALIQGAITLFLAFVEAIPQIIPPLIQAIPQIVTAIINSLPVLLPALLDGAVQLFMGFVQAIGVIIPELLTAIGQILKALWDGLVAGVKAIWENIKTATSQKWNEIKTAITTPINNAKTTVSGIIDSIKNKASGVWNSIKSTTSAIWNGIKNAIVKPIESAKNLIKGIIDKIKGFFNFKISWPKIPMPQFFINPPGWKIGDLIKGKIPKLDIKWKAKGGIFDKPTIFDTRYGLQGVGEAGPEAVAPIDTLQKYVAEAVASQNGGLLKGIYELIEEVRKLNADMKGEFDETRGQEIKFNNRELGRLIKQYG